jgi:signal transduction histidine kinase
LIQNTEKASNSGAQITLKASHNENHIIIQIIDNGPGLPEKPEDQEKLFQPNTRGTAYKKRTGMGLSLVVKAMEHFNGEAYCDNRKEAVENSRTLLSAS